MAEKIVAERLVFVDECGTHTSLTPFYGYAPREERLRLSGPRKRGKNTSWLSLSFLRSYKNLGSMVGWLGIPETIHPPQHTQMETFNQEPRDEQKIGRIAD
jgi:hypothetical protein